MRGVVGTAVVCGLALSSCATSPKKIEAAYVSPLKYKNHTCTEIATEQAAIEAKARRLHGKLKKRASNDAWNMTFGFVLLPVSWLFLSGGDGPQAAEYAQLKGDYDALVTASRSCTQTVTASTVNGEPPKISPNGQVISGVALIPAKTPSGYCILAAPGYRGTDSLNMPAVTDARPLCPRE